MKKTKGKLNLISLIFGVLVYFGCAGTVFAFFTGITAPTDTVHFYSDSSGSYEVANEYALRLISNHVYYNSMEHTPSAADRRSLKLTSDIKLSQDLTVTSDINLNLNGNSIDLNGHTLKFSHSGYGSFLLINGSIINTSEGAAGIVIDTLNAAVITEGLTVGGNVTYTLKSFSREELISAVFKKAQKYFSSFYTLGINSEGNIIDHYYIYKDLELMTNFYNYGINLDWSSSNEAIVSKEGYVTLPPADNAVQLTLTVSGGELEQMTGSRVFNLMVICGTFDRTAAGISEVDNYLEFYKYGSTKYYIYNNVELPSANSYYNLLYTYSAVNTAAGSIVDLQGSTLLRGIVKRKITLTLTVKNLITNATISKNYVINTVNSSNYELANNIISQYGMLVIEGEDTTLPLIDTAIYEENGISGINYSFTGNNGYYAIDSNNTLYVENLPSLSEKVSLDLTFNFFAGSPLTVSRQMRIYYIDSSLSGGTGEEEDENAYYYAYLTDYLLSVTNGKTFVSFEMPNQHVVRSIRYSLSSTTEGIFSGYIKNEGEEEKYWLYYLDGLTPVKVIETTINTELNRTVFTIFLDNLLTTDINVNVGYFFDDVPYTKTSTFYISGVILNNQKGMPDSVLHGIALEEFDENTDGILTLDEAKADYGNAVFTVNTPVGNFKGLNFLSGITRFNFDGSFFNGNAMQYLAGIAQNITFLSLAGNGIADSDLSQFPVMKNLLTLDMSGNSITSLSNLPVYQSVTKLLLSNNSLTGIRNIYKFPYIQEIYIDGNEIQSFRELLDITALRGGKVYLYNNGDSADGFGSAGRYNLTTFVLLSKKNVEVYREHDGTNAVRFVPTASEIEGTEILEGIIYVNYSNQQTSYPNYSHVILPYRIYKNAQNLSDYYELHWENLASYTVTFDPVLSPSITPSVGDMLLSHINSADFILYVSVDITDNETSVTTTVCRPFFIKVNP